MLDDVDFVLLDKNYLSMVQSMPSRFAGGRKMDEKEAEELKKELRDMWKKWE